MVITKAKEAIRRHLITSFPNVNIAIEGVPFDAPASSDLYVAIQFVIHPPTDPTYGPYYYRENIGFQVFVTDKLGVGTARAETLAEEIREVFDKSLTLLEDNYRLQVLRTPHINGAVVTSDRLVIPLTIPFQVEVYKQ